MIDKHVHRIVAKFMMRVLDYDSFTLGCETCGPQWVITINWFDCTFHLAWVNVDLGVYFDSRRRQFVVGDAIFSPLDPTDDASF